MTAAVQTSDAEINLVLDEEDRRGALSTAEVLAGIDPDLLPIEASTPETDPPDEIRCGSGAAALCFEPAAPGKWLCETHYAELVASGLVAGLHHRCATVGCSRAGAPTWCSQHKRGRSRADGIAASQAAKESLAAAADVLAARLPPLLENRRGRALGTHPNAKIFKAALARAIERGLVVCREPDGLYLPETDKQSAATYRASIARAAKARREDLVAKIAAHVARADGVVSRPDLAIAIDEPLTGAAFDDAIAMAKNQGAIIVVRRGPLRGIWRSQKVFARAQADYEKAAGRNPEREGR
jgi:hypothetical protein